MKSYIIVQSDFLYCTDLLYYQKNEGNQEGSEKSEGIKGEARRVKGMKEK
jgi:hypothetical protein